MMGSFADFLENELLDHVFGAAAYTAPATLYIGLSTTTITDAGGNITEPSGNGYARVAVTNDKTNWTNAAAGALENATEITFPQATGSWGTVTDFFIADAAVGGNILGYGALSQSKAIGNGDTAKFAAGDLDISLD